MLKYIEPLYFFLALFIGLFFTYISTPIPDIVIKYPTPENTGKIIYKDDADVCYKYRSEEVECPVDKSKIRKLTVQHINNKVKNDQGFMSILKQKLNI